MTVRAKKTSGGGGLLITKKRVENKKGPFG
jgi:hypothetical protein